MTELDSLKKKISEDPQSFIVIIGAGASIPAGLPSWKQLKETLCASIQEIHNEDDADKEIALVNSAPSLWVAFSRLKAILGTHRYEKEIKQCLDISGRKTPSLYKQIWELNVAGIVNFNIDNFAINSFSEVKKAAVDYATAKEPHKYKNYPLSSDKFIFQPHGTISDSQSWVFTETDRQDLYFRNEDFKKVMAALFASKNLLIIGFNPDEWSFRTLLSEVGITNRLNGYHNYYVCPNPQRELITELGELGISVIPYYPTTEMHDELNQQLQHIIGYRSTDAFAPSIYEGKVYTKEDIPDESNCYKVSINELRDILNGVVAGLIPPDTVPTEEQINDLEDFYSTYIMQLHRAWLVDPRNPNTNSVYQYTAKDFVGRGAFGSVYEVVDTMGHRYALKVLLPEARDNISYLSCFRRGIRSMGILKEKGIEGMVKIHGSYEVPACIIMDYVDGITLREAIDNRYIDKLEIKLSLLEKIARVIHSAHQLEERILHRDLKPENVMIENCYSSADFDDPREIPEIKILDFDLSWHRGATEKTVMFGAISQGFMAPEQIDAASDKALSRSTAVDVYSIGMLMYFTLTGYNPMPNESLFKSFPQRVQEALDHKYRYNWKCLPGYLANTILSATNAEPLQRMALDTFINNLQIAKEMYLHNVLPNSHPLVLVEIKDRIDCNGEATFSDYGRSIHIEYTSLAKKITLSTTSEGSKIKLNVMIERYVRGSDQRDGIAKYFQRHKEKAMSVVNTEIFHSKIGRSSEQSAQIEMAAYLPDVLTLDYVDAIASNIAKVRRELDG